ncbi:MAG: hypothetical protein QXG76_03940 [Candidatus Bathyarchaeia archaeon]
MPKGHSGKVGCYVPKTKTIHVANQEKIGDPFVVLRESLPSSSNLLRKT